MWRCEMNRRRDRRQAGITLIEMLVVVTIIALFAALVAPVMFRQSDKARVVAARAQIRSFMTALGSYKLDTGVLPSSDEGLQALRVKPGNLDQWQGPYLPKDIPLDPWGHPYVYKYPRRARRRARHHLLRRRRPTRRRRLQRRHPELERQVGRAFLPVPA